MSIFCRQRLFIKKMSGSLLGIILVLVMSLGLLGTDVYAATNSKNADIKTGSFEFTSNDDLLGNALATDTFTYSDRLFTGSSYNADTNLALLSCQAAMASSDYSSDPKGRANEENPVKMSAFLKKLGFTSIETNKYYKLEKEENSIGCIIGRKKIKDGSKSYTLLAIIPRGINYKQEWAGNFNVGNGAIHDGFLAARDEVLRFTNSYITKNKIKGNLKVWTAGFSRGAAVSNLVGAFFAEGGGDYFKKNKVTIKSTDVYCYNFAVPQNIRTGEVTKKQILSVAGYRGNNNSRYANDTNVAAYTYSGKDGDSKSDPASGVYRCIKYWAPGYDLITNVAPSSWGYGRYGVEILNDISTPENKSRMLTEFKKLCPVSYESYIKPGAEGDEDVFNWKTFDFATLGFVTDNNAVNELGSITQAQMFYDRVNNGLTRRIPDAASYVNGGYEKAFRSLGGLVGMATAPLVSYLKSDIKTLVKAGAFSYLAYAKERLQEENNNLSESEAIEIAVEQFIEFLTGEDIDRGTLTVDQFFEKIARYLVDNTEQYEVEIIDTESAETGGKYDEHNIRVKVLKFRSQSAEKVFNLISNGLMNQIPENYKGYLPYLVPGYDSKQNIDSDTNKNAISNFVFGMLQKCAYGDGGSKGNPKTDSAFSSRKLLYAMTKQFMSSGDFKDIVAAMGADGSGIIDGRNNAALFLNELMKYLMVETDPDNKGKIIHKYNNIDEAADGYLCNVIENARNYVIASGYYDAGSVYYNDIITQSDSLKAHIRQLRETAMNFVMYEKGKAFNVKDSIRMISTFAAQVNKISLAHLPEKYVSWLHVAAGNDLDISNLKVNAKISSRKINLSWDASLYATSYKVAYRPVGKSWITKTVKKNKKTLTGLKKDQLYEVRVSAVSKQGSKSIQSEWSEVITNYISSPGKSLKAGKESLTIKTVKVKNATGYEVSYATNKSFKDAVVNTYQGANNNKITLTGLTSKKYYYVKTRPYRVYNGITYYGAYNSVRRAKIK